MIIVLLDTLRADHLSSYGYEHKTSPNIDEFAKQAVVFRRHYSHSSRTGPSVATIFTGLYPRSHGVINPLSHWDAKGTLTKSQTTLAEILKDYGFTCTGFITNPNIRERFGFKQGFGTYRFLRGRAGAVNEKAKEFLAGSPGKRPFFLYLHYMDTHSPYDAPKAYESFFVDPAYAGPVTGDHRQLDYIVSGKFKPTKADIRHMKALYDQELLYFDSQFGQLMDFLKKRGLFDNSVIVFLSDHGEEFVEHGMALHGYTVYEEQLLVPLLIRAPGYSPTVVNSTTLHVDIMPTLLELLGIKAPKPLQGSSLTPLMKGEKRKGVPVFAHTQLRAVKTVQVQSLRLSDWKLIEHRVPEKPYELYHLGRDPGELQNAARQEPDLVKKMAARLSAFVRSLPPAKGKAVALTPEEIEELRSLGYIE